jgi:hypothetical protein
MCHASPTQHFLSIQTPSKQAISFQGTNQYIAEIFDRNILWHVREIDNLDLKIAVSPDSWVEDCQDAAIRG